ncbi:MAG TPA: hypothetical protein VIV15_15680, partial [Anaerolineales bacterium]
PYCCSAFAAPSKAVRSRSKVPELHKARLPSPRSWHTETGQAGPALRSMVISKVFSLLTSRGHPPDKQAWAGHKM